MNIKKQRKKMKKESKLNAEAGHISGASAEVGSNPNSMLDVEDFPL